MPYFFVIKVGALAAFTTILAVAWTPLLTHYLYKYKCWKKKAGKLAWDGTEAVVFNALHKEKDTATPRMGGILVWVTVLVVWLLFALIHLIWPESLFGQFSFSNRSQTWIPLFTLFAASVIGTIDDLLVIRGVNLDHKQADGGIKLRHRLIWVALIGLVGALWFYFKLDWTTIHIPFWQNIDLGWLMIPFFIGVVVTTFASGVIDGIDGLSGGVFLANFAAYGTIAYARGQFDLAAFCAVIGGALVAFLWFNIPPARFYMTESGILGLTTTLAVVAFFTDAVLLLPLIGLPLLLTVLSNIIQVLSKKYRGKKVFLVAPLHHHFEAMGWPACKVTMRYWIFSGVCAVIGTVIALADLLITK